ncbi:hypothetical protein AAHE18_20G169300 [Arachis hypogaea]
MDQLNGSANLMIVSDLDFTMVDHDDPENLALLRFNALWEAYYRHNSLLVFSTGRSPTIYCELRKQKPLLTPDITIMSVGTEITYGESMVPDDRWEHYLNHKWNRDIVLEETARLPELVLQSETEQRPHKVSFYLDKTKASKVMQTLSRCLEKRGVSNAQEELLQWYAENAAGSPKIIHATERCADGIIQAISKFSLGPNVSPRDIRDSMYNRKSLRPCHEVVMFYLFYERWRRAEVENSEEYVQYLKSIIGVEFRVWVDRISTSMVSSGSWLVKFDKWELSGNELRCCSTKVLVNSKIDAEDQFTWMHIHQTWVDGFGEKDDMSWVI